jgi:hypothetical protein
VAALANPNRSDRAASEKLLPGANRQAMISDFNMAKAASLWRAESGAPPDFVGTVDAMLPPSKLNSLITYY